MGRGGWFIFGAILGIFLFAPAAVFVYARLGGMSMDTAAKPLPLEGTFARVALRASVADAAILKDPLPVDEANLTGGVQVYRTNCAICHGIPGQLKTAIAAGEFPPPPQLFEKGGMATDHPEGATFWKVTHGIRLSGMPGFGASLTYTERWRVSMLLANADKLPPAVTTALSSGGGPKAMR